MGLFIDTVVVGRMGAVVVFVFVNVEADGLARPMDANKCHAFASRNANTPGNKTTTRATFNPYRYKVLPPLAAALLSARTLSDETK